MPRFAVTLSDNGDTGNGGSRQTHYNLMLTINPINDPPSFTSLETNFVTSELNTTLIRLPFAADIQAGPANEWGCGVASAFCDPQTVQFETVDVSDPALFLRLPRANVEGELSFVSAPNATGTATGGLDMFVPVSVCRCVLI